MLFTDATPKVELVADAGVSQPGSRSRPQHMGGDRASEYPCLSGCTYGSTPGSSTVVLLCLLGGATFPLSSVWWCCLGGVAFSSLICGGCCIPSPPLGGAASLAFCVLLPSFSSFGWGCFLLLLGGALPPPSLGGVGLLFPFVFCCVVLLGILLLWVVLLGNI